MKFRAAVATAAVVPLALGLAACGGNEKPAAVPPPTPTPTTVASSEPSKTVETPIAPPAVVRLNRVTFVPEMNSALTKATSWRTFATMKGNGQTLMTIRGVQSVKPAAMSMEMTGAAFKGKTAKMIVSGGAGYASIPGATPAGKYLKFKSGQVAELDSLLKSGDPTQAFKSFDKSLVSVKFVGEDTIVGEKMEQYEVNLNAAKMLATQGKKLPKGMPATIPYTLWMDKSHRVRRMEFDVSGVSMEMTLSDYNKPVSITAPPASKIVS
ncbi:hypothetical protein E1263_21370 [Kribbella antibiotica]|uniref:LppX_LprAFG lipoprotein n=1 Tax=Kribbella antibiotica TaxID=190195 RepID=A0A4R4ZHM0_9ACTN|nr:LppX_LprAFG lipoprotein [Kribbella antibiotica]TDD57925.1 hypothetical protein E1263_21370 [Kribbella antibiotica]